MTPGPLSGRPHHYTAWPAEIEWQWPSSLPEVSHFAVDDASLFTSVQTRPEPRGRGGGAARQGCDLEVINRGRFARRWRRKAHFSTLRLQKKKARKTHKLPRFFRGGPKDLQRRRVAGGSEWLGQETRLKGEYTIFFFIIVRFEVIKSGVCVCVWSSRGDISSGRSKPDQPPVHVSAREYAFPPHPAHNLDSCPSRNVKESRKALQKTRANRLKCGARNAS